MPLYFMKVMFSAGLLLVCCLSLLGGVSVAPVQAQDDVHKPVANKAHATSKPAPVAKKPVRSHKPKAGTSHRADTAKPQQAGQARDAQWTSPRLDLSLPPDMIKQVTPTSAVSMPTRKPLLPSMFVEKPEEQSPFQLNGRLISNQMGLRLRNENHQEIEGAALDFEFKH